MASRRGYREGRDYAQSGVEAGSMTHSVYRFAPCGLSRARLFLLDQSWQQLKWPCGKVCGYRGAKATK